MNILSLLTHQYYFSTIDTVLFIEPDKEIRFYLYIFCFTLISFAAFVSFLKKNVCLYICYLLLKYVCFYFIQVRVCFISSND